MKLFPRGRYLPVHCCCSPALRLGWVPGPIVELGARFKLVIHEPHRVRIFGEPDAPRSVDEFSIDVTVKELHRTVRYMEPYQCPEGRWHHTVPVSKRMLAIDSHDQPIETWRRVPGFIEDQAARSQTARRSPSAASWAGASRSEGSRPRSATPAAPNMSDRSSKR